MACVTNGPSHGTLSLGQFTQADIDSGSIVYEQPGGAASSDSFSVVITDPAGHSLTEAFPITILTPPPPPVTTSGDVLERDPTTSQLVNWEYNGAGAPVGQHVLTYTDGTPLTIGAATTVAGAGTNFGGQGGNDVFLIAPSDQLAWFEFNSAGTEVSGTWNTTYQGGPTYVPPSDIVVGTGTDFGGTGGTDAFFRSSTNQLGYLEFNNAGAVINGNWDLTYQGGPTYVPPSDSIVGTGTDFGGTGGSDAFFRSSTNQLGYLEFNSAGAVDQRQLEPDVSGWPHVRTSLGQYGRHRNGFWWDGRE